MRKNVTSLSCFCAGLAHPCAEVAQGWVCATHKNVS